jgi:6-phosphogluconolactonase (cycloisomerase 2 family)
MFTFKKVLFLSCVLCLSCAATGTTLQAQNAGFVYVTNGGGNSGAGAGSISAYSIDSQTGALLPVPGSPFPDPGGPWSMAVDPKGRFAYAVNVANDTISAYAIDGNTGALTPVPGSPFPQDPTLSGERPVSVAIDPAGNFVFVANYYFSSVRAYRIDQNTGTLSQAPGSPFPAGINPESVTVDLNGQFAYVANGYHGGNGTVSAYSIDRSSGSLTPVPGSPFAVPIGGFPAPGSVPCSVTVHATATGEALYVADSWRNYIWEYIIDQTTGALAASPTSPFSAPGGPYSISAAPHAQYVYLSNQYPSYPTGSVAGYTIDTATGSLTAVPGSPFLGGMVPVGLAVDPKGQFVFIANQGSWSNNFAGTVSAFTIDANTGVLSPVPGSPFAAGLEPTSVTTTLNHAVKSVQTCPTLRLNGGTNAVASATFAHCGGSKGGQDDSSPVIIEDSSN